MDKTFKNALALIGAAAVVKTAPVLAVGAAIGAVASNPEKVKKAAEDLAGRVEAGLAKYGVEIYPEDECECCNGGPCTCKDECDCDSENAEAPAEEAEPTSWEEAVPDVEEEEIPTEEPEADPEPAPAAVDKMEILRTKGEEFLAALRDLAEETMKK